MGLESSYQQLPVKTTMQTLGTVYYIKYTHELTIYWISWLLNHLLNFFAGIRCTSVTNESIMFFADGLGGFENLQWLMAIWILQTPSTGFK